MRSQRLRELPLFRERMKNTNRNKTGQEIVVDLLNHPIGRPHFLSIMNVAIFTDFFKQPVTQKR